MKYAAIAGGSVLLPVAAQQAAFGADPNSRAGSPYTLPFRRPPVLPPVRSDGSTDYYQIIAQTGTQQFIPRKANTTVYGYDGMFPGPLIRQRKDRQSVVRMINNLDIPMSTHLHGMAALPEFDGWANDISQPGYYKDYVYPNNRAATIWYHDHAVHQTATNVNLGLAGMYIVYDEAVDNTLNLPKGPDLMGPGPYGPNTNYGPAYDVPLVLHDKLFDRRGEVDFDGDPTSLDDGDFKDMFGDVITINGVAWPRMPVERRKYRFRMLNASISRSYELQMTRGARFTMIATDAGYRSSPATVRRFIISPAERYEFVIDFSEFPIGEEIKLRNRSLPNNEDYNKTDDVMMFEVVSDPTTPDTSEVPSTLQLLPPLPVLLSQAQRTRELRFGRDFVPGNPVEQWTINGRVWDQNDMEANPPLEGIEIWNLVNNSGGWHHPIHVHLLDFMLIDRNGRPAEAYEQGWKDVFYLGENETVRIIGKFGPHAGRFMFHCHNLVHEDHDMMRGFQVGNVSTNPSSVVPPQPYDFNNPPVL